MNQEILGDCLDIMPTLESGSVDCIITDLPYGTTACKWDTVIPFEPLWVEYKRLIKANGVIVLFGSQPFASALIMSNPQIFKYEWVWKKPPFNFLNSSHQPLRNHENILVFYKEKPTYNKQDIKKISWKKHGMGGVKARTVGDFIQLDTSRDGAAFPTTIIDHIKKEDTCSILHPTQKPVELISYLIRTYTNDGETVLDSCAGSFTTAIACISTNRNYICIERDPEYYRIGTRRIKEHLDKKANELQF